MPQKYKPTKSSIASCRHVYAAYRIAQNFDGGNFDGY